MSRVRFGVSYFGVRDPRHAAADVAEIADSGFAAITHTFSEHDLRYHVRDVARIVLATKARGLEADLDPWGVAGLFGGEAYSELALREISCRQIDAEGRSVPACCPNAPQTRALLDRWTRTAADMGADALFWDEPHFYLGALLDRTSPAPTCRCMWCEAAWSERQEGGLPAEGDARLAQFRGESLRDLLSRAIGASGAVVHSLCLLPRGEFRGAGTDEWEEFAAIPGISRLATDPYWMQREVDPAAYVREHAAPLRSLCDRTGQEMEVWIQGIRIPRGAESHIVRATEAAVEAGAKRVAYWSFRGTERMSWLACEDPDAAWSAMREAVRRFG